MSLSDYSCNRFSAISGSGNCFAAGTNDDGLAKDVCGDHHDRSDHGGRSGAAWPRRASTSASLASLRSTTIRSIRRRTDHRLGSNRTIGAETILNDEGLAEGIAQPLCDHPRHPVGIAAGGEGFRADQRGCRQRIRAGRE
jgi:hypothetical protein